MEKFKVEKMYLEVTRNCNLACKHCLRGNREFLNISFETIDNAFRSIKEIDVLLLSGGEPLLAVNELKHIAEVIKNNNILVRRIGIVTNGTVFSEYQKEALDALSSSTLYLTVDVSGDKFHDEEVARLGLEDKRQKNYEELEELYSTMVYNPAAVAGKGQIILSKTGRAKDLTDNDIKSINNAGERTNYVLKNKLDYQEQASYVVPYYSEGKIYGNLSISTRGTIVDTGLDFATEDALYDEAFDLNKHHILTCVRNFISYKLQDKDNSDLFNKQYVKKLENIEYYARENE